MDIATHWKSVRMDVYIEDEEHTVHDVEMQRGDEPTL